LNQEDGLSPSLFNFASGFVIEKIQENKSGLDLSGTRQLLVCADDVNVFGENINTIIKTKKLLLDASEGVDQEVKAEKTVSK
jgi:hypothetical protein